MRHAVGSLQLRCVTVHVTHPMWEGMFTCRVPLVYAHRSLLSMPLLSTCLLSTSLMSTLPHHRSQWCHVPSQSPGGGALAMDNLRIRSPPRVGSSHILTHP